VTATLELDRSVLRSLAVHEAGLQATGGRQLRDVGDGVMLLDPRDPEPYWNRLVAPAWPDEPADFHRRLDAAITLFATLGRLPHIWPFPTGNQPIDIVARLLEAGFELMGSDLLMVLADPDPSTVHAAEPLPPGVTVERLRGLTPASLAAAPDLAAVLADAFEVDEERRGSIELETLAALEGPALNLVLLRVDGEPAAVAKRSTQDGASYLSSIGTRRHLRGQGFGGLATAIATAEAVTAGSRWTYLKVDAENDRARRLYERLGFQAVPGHVHDLLLNR
jgi:ribosomal protein S18 acetylase RimI-like enzyme